MLTPGSALARFRGGLRRALTAAVLAVAVIALPATGLAQGKVTFADPNLDAAVRAAIGKPTGEILVSHVAALAKVYPGERGIGNLGGMEHLTQLTHLWLYDNQITHLTPLSGLTQLTYLGLYDNQISDIRPLVDNPGLGEGDCIALARNPLNDEAYDVHIPALQARGANVLFDPKTGVPEAKEPGAVPSAYLLYPNAPNPFNPRTSIAYDLPEAVQVSLTVYSGLGQKVATLVSGVREAGHCRVRWDGSGFASGVYLYRLEAGTFVETRRMVLIN